MPDNHTRPKLQRVKLCDRDVLVDGLEAEYMGEENCIVLLTVSPTSSSGDGVMSLNKVWRNRLPAICRQYHKAPKMVTVVIR